MSEKQKTDKHILISKIRNFVLIFLFVSIIASAGVGAGMYAAVAKEIGDMNIQNVALNYSSSIYYNDDKGNSQQIQQIYSEANRIWVSSEKIPQNMKDAIVSIEDERFYQHHGVDIKRTTGAVVNWVLNKVGVKSSTYGGSTITQQVIKNITKEDEKSVSRKIKEMMRAVAMEKQLSKDEILTMYLNIVYFANNCYGVEAASNIYFDKSVDNLTLAQAASIAGITQTPAKYNPFEHPDNNVEKRNIILAKMLKLGKITQDQYNKAVEEKLVTTTAHKDNKSNISSYFVDQVISDVIADLQKQKGYSNTFAEQQVYNGGLKIYTTMDKNIQTSMESVFTNTSNFPKISTQAQSAMIIIDPYTGEIKGLVGGLGKKTDVRGLNRATQTKRQPGSALKPLAVYAPAIENDKMTAASTIIDEPITIGNWSPKNSYSGYKGDILVKKAVEISANIPAVKVLQTVGVETSYNFLKNKFNISTLTTKDKNLSSLGLGGLTSGVTLKEMATAYGVFVNGGKYNQPYTYTKVVDNTGKVLLENKPNPQTAIRESTAFIMSDILKAVVNGEQGTAKSAKLSKMPTYGKTGTTNDDLDKWFVGYTPYYVGAVWYGFDTPKSISSAGVSYNPSARAWRSVMEKVHSNLPVKDFQMPSSVVSAQICSVTGLIASSNCNSYTGYFENGTQPKTVCSSKHGSYGINVEDNAENSDGSVPNTQVEHTPLPTENQNSAQNTQIPSVTEKPITTQAPTKNPEQNVPIKTEKPSNDTSNNGVIRLD